MVNFQDLNRWFHELSPQEQAAIRSSHPPLDALPKRLLPEDHGNWIDAHIEAAKRRFQELSNSGQPFYLARISDCEVVALGCGYLAHSPHPFPRERMPWLCGFGPDFLRYRKELLQAFQEAHLLGVQENWLPWKMNTLAIFSLLGWPAPHPNAVEIHLPYKMLVDGSLFKWIQGKRVLLIGGLAQELAAAWVKPAFIQAYRGFGDLGQTVSVTAIRTAQRGERSGSWEDIERVTEAVSKSTFDVALLSAAVPAKILARRIWKMGKSALDVGFVFDALLGDEERKLRPMMKDVKWPRRAW